MTSKTIHNDKTSVRFYMLNISNVTLRDVIKNLLSQKRIFIFSKFLLISMTRFRWMTDIILSDRGYLQHARGPCN